MIAGSPTYEAGLVFADLVSLTFETGLIDAILADGTVLDCHIPAPESNCVPLFDFDSTVDLHLNKEFKYQSSQKKSK